MDFSWLRVQACLCGLPVGHALDLAPTILNLMGAPIPEYCEGKPLFDVLSFRQFSPAFRTQCRVPKRSNEGNPICCLIFPRQVWRNPGTSERTHAEMLNHGVESKIAASQDSSQEDTHEHNGVEVYRYPVFPEPNPNRIMDNFPWRLWSFASWQGEKADIYNQHQWTPKCGLPHLRLAKELNMATVVTVHLPYLFASVIP